MNRTLTTKFNMADRKVFLVLALCVLALVVFTMTQDLLRSDLKNSAFYFSESFMFSSFWWPFAPLFFVQYFAVIHKKNKNQLAFRFAIIVLPIVVHLFTFPFFVWVLSKIFYYHTYSFQQTFRYTLSEHLYLLVLLYSIPVLAFQYFTKNKKRSAANAETQYGSITNQFVSTIIVSEGNKKHHIAVSEVLYFSANPPYINIHLEGKKYLHNETLKSISNKLNPEQFVRVHKSTIVHIKMVASYTTRLNGDYDLTMKNNVQIRVSRNFAINFKNLFNKPHPLTAK